MADLYNIRIEKENAKIDELRVVQRVQVRTQKRETEKAKKPRTFIIISQMEVTYLQPWYENNVAYTAGTVVNYTDTSHPITDVTENIPQLVRDMEMSDGYKEIKVLSYTVEYMNTTKLAKSKKPKIKQRMRRSFVLANHWLKYAHGISESAYEESGNKCVYHQLVEYLSNPPSNLPSNFISYTNSKKQHLSEESLYRFFCEKIVEGNLQDDYQDFTIDSGVSSELIALLCESLHRNMYAFDEDENLFHTVTSSNSKNYCPVVFYKFNGHCFIINDKSIISSTAETNKYVGKKIISITMDDKKVEINSEVFHIDNYDVSNSRDIHC